MSTHLTGGVLFQVKNLLRDLSEHDNWNFLQMPGYGFVWLNHLIGFGGVVWSPVGDGLVVCCNFPAGRMSEKIRTLVEGERGAD